MQKRIVVYEHRRHLRNVRKRLLQRVARAIVLAILTSVVILIVI